ncbi:hypothetical protein SLE2022_266410 [Rubroshorea leprosula]
MAMVAWKGKQWIEYNIVSNQYSEFTSSRFWSLLLPIRVSDGDYWPITISSHNLTVVDFWSPLHHYPVLTVIRQRYDLGVRRARNPQTTKNCRHFPCLKSFSKSSWVNEVHSDDSL